MRYYAIIITGAPADVFPVRYDGGAQWGTIANGQHDANAQQIDFQIQEWSPTNFAENCVLNIYGVSWEQIKASNQLVGKPITFLGGMSQGLPLATVQSQRDKLLLQGTILKCWGNWIGNETSIGMTFVASGAAAAQQSGGGGSGGSSGGGSSGGGGGAAAQSLSSISRYSRVGGRSIDRRLYSLGRPSVVPFDLLGDAVSAIGGALTSDFSIGPAFSQFGNTINSFFGGGNISPLSNPLNIVHNMLPNMPMSSAIQQTLSTAFPNANPDVRISQALKLGYQDSGMYQSIEQYAGFLQNLSQSILGTNKYPGVNLSSFNNTIRVWDGTQPFNNDSISYLELIGQPTWLTINTISVKVVLRGGLHVGDTVNLPQTLVGFNGADSQLPFGGGAVPDQRTHISLTGTFWIVKILHIGDFRNPDGASWSTNYEASTNSSMVGQANSAGEANQANQNQIAAQASKPQAQSQRLVTRSVRRYG